MHLVNFVPQPIMKALGIITLCIQVSYPSSSSQGSVESSDALILNIEQSLGSKRKKKSIEETSH